jgi:hypothetical protein
MRPVPFALTLEEFFSLLSKKKHLSVVLLAILTIFQRDQLNLASRVYFTLKMNCSNCFIKIKYNYFIFTYV